MGADSKIEWTDHTFNPWYGCTQISPACDHCYAAAWAKRSGLVEWNGPPRRSSAAAWLEPFKWNAEAERAGRPATVFAPSLGDPFDKLVEPATRADFWSVIRRTPALRWILLTKRPQNIPGMLPPDWGQGWPHVALGVTAENDAEWQRRVPLLLAVPAARYLVSAEPLLSAIEPGPWLARLHLVIAGGETGSAHSRPTHPRWARELRDACAAAGVPFHFKRWGDWTPGENVTRKRGIVAGAILSGEASWVMTQEDLSDTEGHVDDEPDLYRVGQRDAGRLLDGVEHNGRL